MIHLGFNHYAINPHEKSQAPDNRAIAIIAQSMLDMDVAAVPLMRAQVANAWRKNLEVSFAIAGRSGKGTFVLPIHAQFVPFSIRLSM
ncbi:MAG: hypothetical protein K2X31_12050 [Sphingopyxis sp.]|nr:hypothetical protein [Sphingopyxis sp.]